MYEIMEVSQEVKRVIAKGGEAEEIKTAFYGEKLEGLLTARSNDLRGIVNGIDYDEYNPETDPYIVRKYNASNFRKEKIKNKRAFQEELGLEKDEKIIPISSLKKTGVEELWTELIHQYNDKGYEITVDKGDWKGN